jgi:transcriptional regulator with XRE-family HTH domain
MLGTRLKAVRNRKGMSQGQVARYAGVAQSTLSELERGEIAPKTIDALVNLAGYFGCSVDYLLGTSNDFSPAANRNASEAAVEAINLIDSLPPERRAAAVELLRNIIVFAEVGVPLPSGETGENTLPEPVPARQGGGVTKSGSAELGPQKIMNGHRKDDLLALLKKMVASDVYERVRLLVESGELVEGGKPLSEAEIDGLLQSFGDKPIQNSLEFVDDDDLGNGR